MLDQLIEEDLACINELILTDLAPALLLKDEANLLEDLQAIDIIPLNVDWDIVRDYQFMNLQNGINKVGIPDLIILQQVIDQKISLFSFSKHFRLMQKHLNFDIITD